jgi:UDP-N-acetylmuramoylalanine--D-glutamate ligase
VSASGVAGLRVFVAGLGRSGVAAARAALDAGAEVLVHDDAAGVVAQRAGTLVQGGAVVVSDPERLFTRQPPDVVVASPGLSPRTPMLAAARGAGVEIWSEPELAWRLLDGRTRLLAITGTNGKTTTTELLAACMNAPAAGNIGVPLVALAADPPPLAVVELSSFQLHFSHTLRADVGVILNVADDHLDWHGDGTAYASAKARIWRHQRNDSAPGMHGRDWAVTNAEDAGCRRLVAADPPPAGHVTFGLGPPAPGSVGIVDGVIAERITGQQPTPVIAVDALGVHGRHNVANAAAAAAAAIAAGSPPATLAGPLAAARVGAHRLEVIAHEGGVRWINDSKATNPHAAAAALRSFESVIWIAGGLNKGLSFAPLATEIIGRVRLALTIGTAGPQIAALTRTSGIETIEAERLDRAVAIAREWAKSGDVVLLAPACASMDQFASYAERGDQFRALVTGERQRAGGSPPTGSSFQQVRR